MRKSAFLKLLTNFDESPVLSARLAHTNITKEFIAKALMTQAATKASGPHEINFQILQIIWHLDKT